MKAAKTRKNVQGGHLNKLIVFVGLLVCVLLCALSLYPALREYYVAFRVNEQLLEEFSAVEQRNEQIREQIAYYNTEEGIADRARERFGWVPAGETAVNITGLEVSDSSTVLPEQVLAGSIEAPSGWWTDFLDTLFSVETEPTSEQVPDPFIPSTE